MMRTKITTSFCFFICLTIMSSAQTINIEKGLLFYKHTQNGELLKMGELADRVSGNIATEKLMRVAKRRKAIGFVVAGIGGTFTGLTLSAALSSTYFPIIIPVTLGAIFTGIAFPIFLGANRKVFQAVQVYNNSLENQSQRSVKPQFEFAASPSGVGFLIKF